MNPETILENLHNTRWKEYVPVRDVDNNDLLVTLAELRRAKAGVVVTANVYNGDAFTQKEWKAFLKNDVEASYTVVDAAGDEYIVDEENYNKALAATPKAMLSFDVEGHRAWLSLSGRLKIGCQAHTLSVWRRDGAGIVSDNVRYDDAQQINPALPRLLDAAEKRLKRERAKRGL